MGGEDYIEEKDIMEDPNGALEQALAEDFDDQDDSLSEPEPPDTSESSQDEDDDDLESTTSELNWPLHERCVHGEINNISVPLDRSDFYYRLVERPHELESLSKYHYREWSEVEHILMPVIEIAEAMYGEDLFDSPCSSPSPIGL